ncbi:MAG: NAD(P)/FAD-dependent oxidoreductase [Acidaminococcaceae bacterium]
MNFVREADVVVIGGGIVGTAILRELSKYKLKSVLVEKEPDVAMGTTKSNSAILHAGFDAPNGSLKASTNVRGNQIYHELEDQLDLDIQWTGSLVVATSTEEMATLQELLERGHANGVRGLELLTASEVQAKEPNLTDKVAGALWAPTAGVCWPFGLAVAFAQCALQNQAELLTNCCVTGLQLTDGAISGVETSQGLIKTKYVINAAGVYADAIARLAGDTSFTIQPRKGEYILFDKTVAPSMVSGVVFPTPSTTSKGILICTTTHGNTFIGPNAQDIADKADTAVTALGMEEIMNSARKLLPTLPLGAVITEFSGLRAVSNTGDFIIEASTVPGLIHAAGMQSPGLTAAPAVAEKIMAMLREQEPTMALKNNFKAVLPKKAVFHKMTRKQQAELIATDELYGRVICRCELITEAEIIAAIKAPCGACTVDGVKRRTRAGMGRCQGGFCGPRVTQILARELGISVPEVLKERADSHLFYEKNPADGEDA